MFGPERGASSTSSLHGYVHKSKDEKDILRVTLAGITLSRLRPYDSWLPFCTNAKEAWAAFRGEMKPSAVTRLAVRFINNISIPSRGAELKDYLRAYPEVPASSFSAVRQYFMQLQIPQLDLGSLLVINQASSHQNDEISLLLDIDLFRPTDVPQDDDAIWTLFDGLHAQERSFRILHYGSGKESVHMTLIPFDQPPAVARRFEPIPGSNNSFGPDGSELARRQSEATKLFLYYCSSNDNSGGAALNLNSFDRQLADAAFSLGVDLNSLVADAARHFQSNSMRCSSDFLSDLELGLKPVSL